MDEKSSSNQICCRGRQLGSEQLNDQHHAAHLRCSSPLRKTGAQRHSQCMIQHHRNVILSLPSPACRVGSHCTRLSALTLYCFAYSRTMSLTGLPMDISTHLHYVKWNYWENVDAASVNTSEPSGTTQQVLDTSPTILRDGSTTIIDKP